MLREAAAARLPAHDSEAHPAATARRLRLGQVAGPSGRQADSFMIVLARARRPSGLAAAAGGLAARADRAGSLSPAWHWQCTGGTGLSDPLTHSGQAGPRLAGASGLLAQAGGRFTVTPAPPGPAALDHASD